MSEPISRPQWSPWRATVVTLFPELFPGPLAERFPEVCAAEERAVARVLGGTVERRRHLLAGDGACEYHVRFADGARGPENGRPR